MRIIHGLSIESLERRDAPAFVPVPFVQEPAEFATRCSTAPGGSTDFRIEGTVGIGISGGIPNVAELKVGGKIGVSLGGGILDYATDPDASCGDGVEAYAIDSQSQTFNMFTNMQKARHDAAMAAIQNTR